VYSRGDTKLKYPSGIGSFGQARLIYNIDDEYTLEEHIKTITEPDLVYCFGTSNRYEKGVDFGMIGFCAK
jgi:hypothetical protein